MVPAGDLWETSGTVLFVGHVALSGAATITAKSFRKAASYTVPVGFSRSSKMKASQASQRDAAAFVTLSVMGRAGWVPGNKQVGNSEDVGSLLHYEIPRDASATSAIVSSGAAFKCGRCWARFPFTTRIHTPTGFHSAVEPSDIIFPAAHTPFASIANRKLMLSMRYLRGKRYHVYKKQWCKFTLLC